MDESSEIPKEQKRDPKVQIFDVSSIRASVDPEELAKGDEEARQNVQAWLEANKKAAENQPPQKVNPSSSVTQRNVMSVPAVAEPKPTSLWSKLRGLVKL